MMNQGSEDLLIAIDPGTVKCGVAVLNFSGALIKGMSINRSLFIEQFSKTIKKYSPLQCVIGNGTSSKTLVSEIKEQFSIPVVIIDEFGSTLEARKLWADYEWSKGIYKYVPFLIKTLFEPTSLDSYAAWALGLRFIKDSECELVESLGKLPESSAD